MTHSLKGKADFLARSSVQHVLALLNSDGEEARIAGGAVRNALLGQPVADIDIATTALPAEVIHRATEAGYKSIPTGIEHGTVTLIVDGEAFEVTTLRADIETNGRHAVVRFGRDWDADAARRDFTINGLYADADGNVFDSVGGLKDMETKTLRFIGDADARVREDYLRILRFFRFFAWYGSGRPDADGIRAAARLKDGLKQLSAERVWAELKKLLTAPDPSRALLWMRQSGVLTEVLPESEKWGIDGIHGLMDAERDLGWKQEPMLRLMSIVPPHDVRVEELGKRLKLANSERDRLELWAKAALPAPDMDNRIFARNLYRSDVSGNVDRLRLALSSARALAVSDEKEMMKAAGYSRLLDFAVKWRVPKFPVTGADLLAQGMAPGLKLGAKLRALEDEWVASDFTLSADDLLNS